MCRFTASSVVSLFPNHQRAVPFCTARRNRGGTGRSVMRLAALVLSAMPRTAAAQQLRSASEVVVDKIVTQERAEVQLLREYSPLVETYIQYLRSDEREGAVPNGDQYFLGRADLAKGVELEAFERTVGLRNKVSGGL